MVRPEAVLHLMGSLAVIRPVFHSEADFQHALAWEVQQAQPWLRVRLETRPRPGIHLDLLVTDPADRTGVAVELKYRTDRWVGDFDGEHFAQLGHSARDVSGYDILKDVSRIERMVKDGYATTGVAIAISNDPGYWQLPTFGRTTNADAFRIHEGLSVTGIREWGPKAGAGTMAGREAPIVLTGEYVLRWQDYSDLPGHHGRFRYLVFEVKDRTATGVEAPPDPVDERKSLVPARVAVAPVSDRVPEPPCRSGRLGTPVP